MTFSDKLKAMRKDLASIVDRMNRDKNFDLATLAQKALTSVADLEDYPDADPWFTELDWKWQPENEE